MEYAPRTTDLIDLESADWWEDDDLELLRAAVPEVDEWVASTGIFDSIEKRFFVDGLIDKVMLFRYVGAANGKSRSEWWVILGDLPPFIDEVCGAETAVDAFRSYCSYFRIVAAKLERGEELTDDDPPLVYAYSTSRAPRTPEIAKIIRVKIAFIEEKLIPWMVGE